MVFVGNGSTGELAAFAAAEALEPLRYVAFPAAALRAFLARNAALRSALQLLIGQDLVAKIAA